MSGLSAVEMVQIVASWKQRTAKSGPKIDRSKYTAAELDALDKHVAANFQPVKVIDLFVFKQSWESFDGFPGFGFFFEAFKDFVANRVYPHAGALADQPARTIEILKLLEAIRDEEVAIENRKREVHGVRK